MKKMLTSLEMYRNQGLDKECFSQWPPDTWGKLTSLDIVEAPV